MEIGNRAMEHAKKIRLIIFDVDGVLTDGGIYIGSEGELFKPFFCRDGLGITLAHKAGLKTAVITGRSSVQLAKR
ncbi:MAG: 3-deoxy-D-manno-octulosonate 8-phosphate phosphatase, partial [Selenomonadaceae bacterium]|nr:3-deoxy-D-manno-octulosonate 8-phosphate phosphatase [Selenomonadaceae bacterium]